MNDASIPGLLLRMVVSLAIVTGLLLLAARFVGSQRTGGGAGGRSAAGRRSLRAPRPSGSLQVLARQQLGRTQSIAVVRACGRTLVLGVTPDAVRVLAAGDEPLQTEAGGSSPGEAAAAEALGRASGFPQGWRPVLDTIRERTVRRP